MVSRSWCRNWSRVTVVAGLEGLRDFIHLVELVLLLGLTDDDIVLREVVVAKVLELEEQLAHLPVNGVGRIFVRWVCLFEQLVVGLGRQTHVQRRWLIAV